MYSQIMYIMHFYSYNFQPLMLYCTHFFLIQNNKKMLYLKNKNSNWHAKSCMCHFLFLIFFFFFDIQTKMGEKKFEAIINHLLLKTIKLSKNICTSSNICTQSNLMLYGNTRMEFL